MRINKLMSNAGICSRRDANRLIEEGRVRVNGELCTPGQWVEWTDQIVLDDILVEALERIYILLNKPRGITCTADEEVKDNIISFLDFKQYVFPVGRLDKESEGLMLLTNDGELADQVLCADRAHEKEYVVTLDRAIEPELIQLLSEGVEIFGVQTRPCIVNQIDDRTMRIILSQGLNRQIRKMCKKYGYNVIKLRRTRIVNMMIGDLEPGQWRHLTAAELDELKALISF